MTFRKIRMLITTTLGSIRYAKGQVVELNEAAARNLVALGKAKVAPEKAGGGDDTDRPAVPARAKRKE